MGRFPRVARQYQLQRIQEQHHEVLRQLVLGRKKVDIARDLGITTATVGNIANSEITKRQLRIMQSARDAKSIDIANHIQEIAPKGLKLLGEIIEGVNEGEGASLALRAKTAESMLARAGFGEKHVMESRHLHAHVTGETLQEIKEAARRLDAEEIEVEETQDAE